MVTNATPDLNFIAEIGINHLGSLELAKKHIEEAKNSGATIAKFQTYFTETRVAVNSPIFPILKKCELPLEAFEELKNHCDYIGIEFSSTPFCIDTARYLSSIGCKTFKVASFFLCDHVLIESLIRDRKISRILLSTGVSSFDEVLAVNSLHDSLDLPYKPEIIFMHCVSKYPVDNLEDYNLINVSKLSESTGKIAGYSDHTLGSFAPSIAVAQGALFIEKHFTIDNTLDGADHAMSASPHVFREMVDLCLQVRTSLGNPRGETCFDAEKSILQFRADAKD